MSENNQVAPESAMLASDQSIPWAEHAKTAGLCIAGAAVVGGAAYGAYKFFTANEGGMDMLADMTGGGMGSMF